MAFLKLLAVIVVITIGVLLTASVGYLLQLSIAIRPRRPKESGFEYIYVNDDGSAREVDDDEQIYLETEFHGADGGRPYIKLNYSSLTPDGRLRGYLRRRQLPKNITIDSSPIKRDSQET